MEWIFQWDWSVHIWHKWFNYNVSAAYTWERFNRIQISSKIIEIKTLDINLLLAIHLTFQIQVKIWRSSFSDI